ncbi:hypothetical protein QTN25_003485 [Entamoeba marina]
MNTSDFTRFISSSNGLFYQSILDSLYEIVCNLPPEQSREIYDFILRVCLLTTNYQKTLDTAPFLAVKSQTDLKSDTLQKTLMSYYTSTQKTVQQLTQKVKYQQQTIKQLQKQLKTNALKQDKVEEHQQYFKNDTSTHNTKEHVKTEKIKMINKLQINNIQKQSNSYKNIDPVLKKRFQRFLRSPKYSQQDLFWIYYLPIKQKNLTLCLENITTSPRNQNTTNTLKEFENNSLTNYNLKESLRLNVQQLSHLINNTTISNKDILSTIVCLQNELREKHNISTESPTRKDLQLEHEFRELQSIFEEEELMSKEVDLLSEDEITKVIIYSAELLLRITTQNTRLKEHLEELKNIENGTSQSRLYESSIYILESIIDYQQTLLKITPYQEKEPNDFFSFLD